MSETSGSPSSKHPAKSPSGRHQAPGHPRGTLAPIPEASLRRAHNASPGCRKRSLEALLSCHAHGMSSAATAAHLNDERLTPSRGYVWHEARVRRIVLDRGMVPHEDIEEAERENEKRDNDRRAAARELAYRCRKSRAALSAIGKRLDAAMKRDQFRRSRALRKVRRAFDLAKASSRRKVLRDPSMAAEASRADASRAALIVARTRKAAQADEMLRRVGPWVLAMDALGYTQAARELDRMGVEGPRGGRWTHWSVAYVRGRLTARLATDPKFCQAAAWCLTPPPSDPVARPPSPLLAPPRDAAPICPVQASPPPPIDQAPRPAPPVTPPPRAPTSPRGRAALKASAKAAKRAAKIRLRAWRIAAPLVEMCYTDAEVAAVLNRRITSSHGRWHRCSVTKLRNRCREEARERAR